MNDTIKVSIFMPCFNESEIIKDTIKHYKTNFPSCSITIYDNKSTDNSVEIAKSLGCNVITWDTNNRIDDTKLKELKNNCWKKATDGWVIMVDMDEWICIDEQQLIEEIKQGVTIIRTKGFNMNSDSKSINLHDINLQSVNNGAYSAGYSKSVCFNITKIREINYEHGAHNCKPMGNIKYSKKEYIIKHMVNLGLPYLIEKMKIKYKRSHDMRQIGLATHYTDDTKLVNERYNQHKLSCIKLNVPFMYQIQDNMSYPRKELKFIHITKTAGTSIEDDSLTHDRHWGRHQKEYGWWHEIFPKKPKSLRIKYDWFMVVRNPYTRILSELHYIFKDLTTAKEFNLKIKSCLNFLLTNTTNFEHPYQRAHGDHFTEQYKYLDSSTVIHILYFENIKEEFEQLLSVYNYNSIRLNAHIYSTHKKISITDISEENINLINSIYKMDFETFGYEILSYNTIQKNDNLNLINNKRYIPKQIIDSSNDENNTQKIEGYLYQDDDTAPSIDNKIAIVFLTIKPSEYLINIAKSLKSSNYDIFICVDDNNYKMFVNIPDITIIQYNNNECIKNGYKNSSFLIKPNQPIAWDKALYHFCINATNYKYVWFIEDDVYIPDSNIISIIDNKYPSADILSKSKIINEDGKINWHWIYANNKLPLPWMRSLVCCVRLSKSVLSLVRRYVKKNNELLFIEFLFHTLALHKDLKIESILELSCIEYRKKWKNTDFVLDKLYHPVKYSVDINRETYKSLKYIPVSRVGNKYISYIIKELDLKWGEFHEEYGWRFENFIDKPVYLKEKYDWLLIVRDPYTRILSEYSFLSKNIYNHSKHTVDKFNSIIKTWIENIEQGIENNPKFGKKIGDHFTEQYKYYDEKYKIHIVKYENLQAEINLVLNKYNYKLITKPPEIENDFPFSIDDISTDNIELINRVYKKDFELFHYNIQEIDITIKKQLKFIHITRTGGTSIEQIGLDNNKFWGRYDRSYGVFDESFTLKYDVLKRNYSWFTVVRNPYTRVISEYNYLKLILRIKNSDNISIFNSYIEKWLTTIMNDGKVNGWHLVPQYTYIDSKYDITVIKYENLVSEFNNLMEKYMYDIKLNRVTNVSNNKFSVKDLSSHNIELIKKVYKNDFKQFNYSVDYSV